MFSSRPLNGLVPFFHSSPEYVEPTSTREIWPVDAGSHVPIPLSLPEHSTLVKAHRLGPGLLMHKLGSHSRTLHLNPLIITLNPNRQPRTTEETALLLGLLSQDGVLG